MASDPILFQLSCSLFTFTTSVLPDGYRISKEANFQLTDILGRSSPLVTFQHSGPTRLTVTLPLFSDYLSDKVTNVAKGFYALTFPEQSGIKPPVICTVKLQNRFDNFMCVCTTYDEVGGDHGLWDSDGTPKTTAITATFIGVELSSVDASTWASGGNYSEIAF